MKLCTTYLLACAASILPILVFADSDLPQDQAQSPNEVQQAQAPGPGDPEYDCNNYCGGIIAQARIQPSTVYCFTNQFVTNLNNCMACANTYNIWSSYGPGVTAAAVACGIQPTLQASGNTVITTTVTANPTAASAIGGAGGGLASSTSSGVVTSTSRSATYSASTTGSTSQNTGSSTATRTTSSSQVGLIPPVQTTAGAVRNVAQGAFIAAGLLGMVL